MKMEKMNNKDDVKKEIQGKAITLKNVMDSGISMVDSLYKKAIQQNARQTSCTGHRCLGSLMVDTAGYPNKLPRSKEDTLEQAKDFMQQYYESVQRLDSPEYKDRLNVVESSINHTDTYDMTYEELRFAARTAWRNSPRCIGRISWSSLEVFDCRHVTTAKGMFESILNHLEYATNGGKLRAAITIFPPRKPNTTDYDFKVWNSVIIGYAGYRQPDGSVIGDPNGVELTEIAQTLGWRGHGGRFDVLPLVLQANGDDPEYFDIPPEYILEVNIKHPKYPKFDELGLKWFAVPAVANMLSDFGGIEFTAAPSSGWYMSTEVATRDLCDTGRYNILKEAAEALDIPIGSNTTLWKDRVCLEVNVAVIDSYNKCGVTIVDQHSASESFIKHMANEQKLRGGCPADWVWIVPPMSGSLTQVFHQEMLNYRLRPSYEYQEQPWKSYIWKLDRNIAAFGDNKQVLSFKGVVKSAIFSSILIRPRMAKRTKCTILYASETGRSEMYALELQELFNFAFNATLYSMDKYNLNEMKDEKLVLVVAATTGNGDPTANATEFYAKVSNFLIEKNNNEVEPKSFEPNSKNSCEISMTNSKYSVFGLGSRAYPNFCNFANVVNNVLCDLGGTCLYPICEGCEIEGQDEPFNEWAIAVFKEACEEFDIDKTVLKRGIASMGTIDKSWNSKKFQIFKKEENKEPSLLDDLIKLHNKKVIKCTLKERKNLKPDTSDRQTILVCLKHDGSSDFTYVPGDHIGIYPANDAKSVDRILENVTDCPGIDKIFTIKIQQETEGKMEWQPFKRLPPTNIKQALTYFLDITTPPNQKFLGQLVQLADNKIDEDKLHLISKDIKEYNKWKNYYWPTMGEIFDLFPSVKIPASLLLTQLPVMQQRYYSISSSPTKYPNEVHITLALVQYTTQDGAKHRGVCSGYLNDLLRGQPVACFIRPSANFHMPQDTKLPIYMVGPGTGIAPFRSFWQERCVNMNRDLGKEFGLMHLYFGCRTSKDDIFEEETNEYQSKMAITKVFTALSREPNKSKMYVQDRLKQNKQELYDHIIRQSGHFYVCGSINMAHDVNTVFIEVLQDIGKMSEEKAKNYYSRMKAESRYHEDIFGAGLGGAGQASLTI